MRRLASELAGRLAAAEFHEKTADRGSFVFKPTRLDTGGRLMPRSANWLSVFGALSGSFGPLLSIGTLALDPASGSSLILFPSCATLGSAVQFNSVYQQ